jgi:hypothetical protein
MEAVTSSCVRCGRHLKDPGSVLRGMGVVCAGKSGKAAGEPQLYEDTPVLNDVGALAAVGLVCRRLPDGRVACNLPQVIKHHSPTGFEIGYGGSGPADLALNVLRFLIPMDDAWRLHQVFKWRFISPMSSEGGRVPIEEIRAWLAEKL